MLDRAARPILFEKLERPAYLDLNLARSIPSFPHKSRESTSAISPFQSSHRTRCFGYADLPAEIHLTPNLQRARRFPSPLPPFPPPPPPIPPPSSLVYGIPPAFAPHLATKPYMDGAGVGPGAMTLQPDHQASISLSAQAELELELSLRGSLLVQQQRRIVQLEDELQRAWGEIERLRGKLGSLERERQPNDDDGQRQPRYWTPEEHSLFVEAVQRYGWKDVKAISQHVGTRNPTQVRTHAQKLLLRQQKEQSGGGSSSDCAGAPSSSHSGAGNSQGNLLAMLQDDGQGDAPDTARSTDGD
ncbi:hypothetical protein AB1Y20_006484 [Prymnesium parvum]|uniref:HTH myb-type domain-containing protein n=1 Tax=Prymnesium parvum TaxID=97485 RepID=A0AB34IXL0_PRYPA